MCAMCDRSERLKPQAGSAPPGVQTRIAMAMGAEMEKAQYELSRPELGVELAERASKAARAAYLALVDAANPDSFGMYGPLVTQIGAQSYATEWSRLTQTPLRDVPLRPGGGSDGP
jgi:hypothetical protein